MIHLIPFKVIHNIHSNNNRLCTPQLDIKYNHNNMRNTFKSFKTLNIIYQTKYSSFRTNILIKPQSFNNLVLILTLSFKTILVILVLVLVISIILYIISFVSNSNSNSKNTIIITCKAYQVISNSYKLKILSFILKYNKTLSKSYRLINSMFLIFLKIIQIFL